MKRILVTSIFIIIFFFGCAESNTSKENEDTSFNQIEEASLNQIQKIEFGLKNKSITIQKSCAIKSNDFDNVYFVGAKLSNGKIGVWAIGGLLFSVNDVSKIYSDYPQVLSKVSMYDHGAKEVIKYLQ
jgi:hypothetical protein